MSLKDPETNMPQISATQFADDSAAYKTATQISSLRTAYLPNGHLIFIKNKTYKMLTHGKRS